MLVLEPVEEWLRKYTASREPIEIIKTQLSWQLSIYSNELFVSKRKTCTLHIYYKAVAAVATAATEVPTQPPPTDRQHFRDVKHLYFDLIPQFFFCSPTDTHIRAHMQAKPHTFRFHYINACWIFAVHVCVWIYVRIIILALSTFSQPKS